MKILKTTIAVLFTALTISCSTDENLNESN